MNKQSKIKLYEYITYMLFVINRKDFFFALVHLVENWLKFAMQATSSNSKCI